MCADAFTLRGLQAALSVPHSSFGTFPREGGKSPTSFIKSILGAPVLWTPPQSFGPLCYAGTRGVVKNLILPEEDYNKINI